MKFYSKKIDDPKYGHFDSETEFKYYTKVLLPMQEKGEITNLERQVCYLLVPPFKDSCGNTVRKMEYNSDFTYFDVAKNKTIIVDCKGSIYCVDEKWKCKWKMLKYLQREQKDIEYQVIIEYSPNKKTPKKWYDIENKEQKKEYRTLHAEENKLKAERKAKKKSNKK